MIQFFIEYEAPSASDLQAAISGGGFFTRENIFGQQKVYASCSEIYGPLNGVQFVSAGPFLG